MRPQSAKRQIKSSFKPAIMQSRKSVPSKLGMTHNNSYTNLNNRDMKSYLNGIETSPCNNMLMSDPRAQFNAFQSTKKRKMILKDRK